MRIIRDHHQVAAEARGASAAIGNFDGVHRGHQTVIDIARDVAAREGAPLGVVTFEPHPREVFAPEAPPFRLMNAVAKAHRLEKLGIDTLFELPFGPQLAELSAEAFARDVLARGLGLSHVVVGADFRFGKKRAGTTDQLRELGAEFGFGVTVAELVRAETGQVSSTRIREALSAGLPRDAAEMLGHRHRIEGPVLNGDRRGRDLGYPTANMSIAGLHPPRFGVYAVEIDILTGPHAGPRTGVASIGVRPMFGENQPNIETYLFDFDGDLYGEELSVALVDFLRSEERFDSLEALIAQMDDDSARARAILAAE
ncbi:riboflavin kinase / FMN adenylyltransferase [Tranquillimonas rosea]|uniref:Riboflavin biosynthesis protein n=1 Tax=Tranquillimonas rosea TaxID=641238 RepID=A0A1H9RKW5_9RHOB|nr:bifunctional riboflavin kinase/FAD synthetase [Tranquillimonas rosea]SER72683.1 riboflavin kinase / FMN adenylyltransferase [Tranquillimonas rosea]